jgi:hypothetical protein
MRFIHVLMSVTSNPIRKTDNLIPSIIFTIVLSVNNFAPMHVISEEAGAVRRHGETSSFILHQYSPDLFLFVFLQAPSCFGTSFESFIPIAFLHRPWGKITSFCLPFECCIPIIFLHRPWGKSQAFTCHLSLFGNSKVLKVGKKNITNQAGFMLTNDQMKNKVKKRLQD